ncbi:cytochrome C [Pseudodesulfovibrio sp. JC047]|uniref:cytochrome c3 family protein n=1 Tax=Pseudodesulfovibrio sp. JC047 TaxID=2683199 RepID=UPI0013D8270D|nr:cytochrome c3 family protein [Pseudodesulfovibrio sp. JC047]NDV19431.1 cytochrome C [Pseudodesulfovibrio sp. JC047]
MHVKNTKTPVIFAAILLLVAATIGYLGSDQTQPMPTRILFENKGGKVVFSHLVHHRDYQIECGRCHHDRPGESIAKPGEALACGSCHPNEFNQEFADNHMDSFPDESYCVRCHHREFDSLIFDHEAHEEYASDCAECHHGTDIEPEPQKCSNCHEDTDENDLISMREAGHTSCANCHEDMFDQGLSSCKSCHTEVDMTEYDGDYSSCESCHEADPRELVLPHMNAFHDQCMSCHEEMGAGPYGPDNCNQCHISR